MPDTLILPSFTTGSMQGPFNPSANVNAALGPHAEILVSQLDAQYRIGVKNGEVFFACNQAVVTTTIALASAYTGLVVANPITSKKNLSILKASWSDWVAPAGIAAVGLMVGWSAGGIAPTGLSLYNAKTLAVAISAQGVIAGNGVTLVPVPVWAMMLSSANTSAALPTSNNPVLFDIGGILEIPPGGYIALGFQTVVQGVGSLMWREVDA